MGGWRGASFVCILKKKKRKTIADSQNEKLALCLKFKLLNRRETEFQPNRGQRANQVRHGSFRHPADI